MEKTCTSCHLLLSINSFNFRSKKENKLQSHCKACQAKYAKLHYENNVEYHAAKARRSNDAIYLRNRLYVYNYLETHACITCGESDPEVLEFDHRVPKEKINEISVLVWRRTGLQKIKDEIEKCDVLCCNCHRRKTVKQLGWYKWKQ